MGEMVTPSLADLAGLGDVLDFRAMGGEASGRQAPSILARSESLPRTSV